MEWSNKLIIRFLKLYEREPAIWDPKHPDHKNRHSVHDAWKRIELNLGSEFSVLELKKKKDALMATYRKLLHKMRARNASGYDNDYKPHWFAFDYMERFLRKVYSPNVPNSSEILKQEAEELIENENLQQDESEEPNEDEEMENIKIEVHSLPTTNPTRQGNNQKSPITLGRKRKRRIQSMTATKTRKGESNRVKKLTQPESAITDECLLYTKLLGTKLRALDENTREFAMLQIDHFMFRLRQEKSSKSTRIETPANPWFSQYFPHIDVSDYPSSSKHQASPHCAHQSPPSPQHSQSSASIISPLPPPSPSELSQHSHDSTHSHQSIDDLDPLMAL